MPGTTPTLALRYQLPGDPPDGANLGLNLATDTENAILADRVGVMCQLIQQSAQSGWATGVATAITFGASSETVDTGAFHDTSTNTTRIVIGKKLGWWRLSGVYVPVNSANTGAVRGYYAKNGTALVGSMGGFNLAATAVGGVVVPTFLVQATVATDYVELIGQQFISSGTGGTVIASPAASSFTAIWHCPN